MSAGQKHVAGYVTRSKLFLARLLDFSVWARGGGWGLRDALNVHYMLYKFLQVKHPQFSFFPGTAPCFYKNSLFGECGADVINKKHSSEQLPESFIIYEPVLSHPLAEKMPRASASAPSWSLTQRSGRRSGILRMHILTCESNLISIVPLVCGMSTIHISVPLHGLLRRFLFMSPGVGAHVRGSGWSLTSCPYTECHPTQRDNISIVEQPDTSACWEV